MKNLLVQQGKIFFSMTTRLPYNSSKKILSGSYFLHFPENLSCCNVSSEALLFVQICCEMYSGFSPFHTAIRPGSFYILSRDVGCFSPAKNF